MPVTHITTNFKIKDKSRFIDSVQSTLETVLKLLPHDRLIIFNENCESFYQPFNTTGPYALIEIKLFNGRTLETKRLLYQSLTDLMMTFEIPKENVRIALIEIPKENWGIRGGQAGCDVTLGYETHI